MKPEAQVLEGQHTEVLASESWVAGETRWHMGSLGVQKAAGASQGGPMNWATDENVPSAGNFVVEPRAGVTKVSS